MATAAGRATWSLVAPSTTETLAAARVVATAAATPSRRSADLWWGCATADSASCPNPPFMLADAEASALGSTIGQASLSGADRTSDG